ncbi:2295_t:CDS:2 [Ambispora gerdemannii]|uniref:2295_t:CDS:1 n=1 Tax=Ambispora gerdemannii TaxID=144530 RepID=A0A9N9CQ59_9GLOM|nr:2295_t:CDS:2 [Ambispora gerdemannii]
MAAEHQSIITSLEHPCSPFSPEYSSDLPPSQTPTNTTNEKRKVTTNNPAEKTKKARVSLTALQKKEICECLETDKTLKQKDIAAEYGISKQTVSNIVKAKEQWLKIGSGMDLTSSKHARKATFEDIEEAMKIWVKIYYLLMEKVLVFAKEFEVSDKFLASTGWAKNFKRRDNLKSYKKRGESGSVDMNEIPRFRKQLQDIIKDYEPKDVFNCDETALYWMLEPNRTLACGPVKGKKKSKD